MLYSFAKQFEQMCYLTPAYDHTSRNILLLAVFTQVITGTCTKALQNHHFKNYYDGALEATPGAMHIYICIYIYKYIK